MIHLFREAARLQESLNSMGCRFCFIGGIAVQHWGEPRVTRDLDISLFTGFGGEPPVIDAVLSNYGARISNARDFALQHRVLLVVTGGGVEVDIALAALPYESQLIDRAAAVEFEPGAVLRICTAEDLFVLKAFANRAQDRADLIGIARRRGRELDWDAIVERLAPLAEAKEEPAILAGVRRLRAEYSL
ncbi:MAG: nucleotidyl transferase AbiEii/AbiGii toxin family protein [Gemmatimonadota bacterium]